MTAETTFIRCVHGWHTKYATAFPPRLVLALPAEHTPALIEYRFVESRLRRHIATRFLNRPFSRLTHIGNLQVFKDQKRVFVSQSRAQLMGEVMAAIGNRLVNLVDSCLLPLVPIRASHHARQFALGLRKLLLMALERTERGNYLACTDGGKYLDTHINPNGRIAWMNRDIHFNLDPEAYIPVIATPRDGDVLDGAFNRSVLDEWHPADLRQIDTATFHLESLRIAKGIIEELLAKCGGISKPCKEIRVCAFKVFKGLLKHLTIDFFEPIPIIRLLPKREKSGGVVVVDARDPDEIATIVKPKGFVVHKPARTSKLSERAVNPTDSSVGYKAPE